MDVKKSLPEEQLYTMYVLYQHRPPAEYASACLPRGHSERRWSLTLGTPPKLMQRCTEQLSASSAATLHGDPARHPPLFSASELTQ